MRNPWIAKYLPPLHARRACIALSQSSSATNSLPVLLRLEMREQSFNKLVTVKEGFASEKEAFEKYSELFKSFGVGYANEQFYLFALEERILRGEGGFRNP